MVLPGFAFATFLGWFCGVIILQKPWGTPIFKWVSVPIILSFLYIPFFIFFNVDIIYHASDNIVNGLSSERVDRLVRQLAYFQLVLSNMLIRLIFIWKGRKLADFLCRLKFYSKSRAKANKNPLSVMDLLVTYLVFSCTLCVAITNGILTYYNPLLKSWLQELGRLTHATVYVTLFLTPLIVPVQCAFALILASLAYLGIVFHDYCQYVLHTLTSKKIKSGVSIITSLEPSQQVNKATIPSYPDQLFITNQLRREILARFEIVREIFDLAHEIVSPMALVLLAGSSISVVMRGYESLFFRGEVQITRTINNVGHVVNYLCYFWILQSAQRLQYTISAGKEELEDALVNLSDETNKLEKHAIKDVLKVMSVWNWEFTACEFVVIDRRLASGIFSLILTYVIVLVQLKVSDTPDIINDIANTTTQ